MNVVYTDKARQWADGYARMQQATERLQRSLDTLPDPVEAEWDGVKDERDGTVYTLKLRDFAGEVKASFTPEVLMHPHLFLFRVSGLLSDLLQVRDRKLQQQMREARSTEE